MGRNKQIFSMVCSILMLGSSLIFGAVNVKFSEDNSGTKLSVDVDGVVIGKLKEYSTVFIKGTVPMRIKGAPDLPQKSVALSIGADEAVSAELVDASYEIVSLDSKLIPSRGVLYRNQDISSIPYIEGAQYGKDEWFPKNSIKTGTPFILRGIRGVTVTIIPIQYNPVKGKLRILKKGIVSVVTVGKSNVNVLSQKRRAISASFEPVYKKTFINYSSVKKRYPIEDGDRMLVITASDFEDQIQKLVDWKNKTGIRTKLYVYQGGGTSEIANKIKDEYNGDGLTYVLLVGDNPQLPTSKGAANSDPSDQAYIYLEGSDSYGEAFIGRFSVENSTQADVVINKNMWYEQEASADWQWPHKAFGIAGDDAGGSPSLKDWERIEILRDTLEGYTYDTFDKIYHASASASQVTTSVNAGKGLGVYCGHGSPTSWGTTGFNTSNATALTNTDMTPAIISVACVNGEFMNTTCFAEAWQRSGSATAHRGSISFMGSTINQSWVPPTVGQAEMVNSIAHETYLSWGAIVLNGLCEMVKQTGDAAMADTWTMFGDPSVVVYTDTPKESGVNSVKSIGIGKQTINLTFSGKISGRIGVYSESNGVLASKLIDNATSASLDVDISSSENKIYLTVTGRNIIPSTEEVTVNSGPYLNVSEPKAGVVLFDGDKVDVKWSVGGGATVDNVKIELSLDGGATFTEIASSVDNTGSYSWTVSSDKECDSAVIKVSDMKGSVEGLSQKFAIKLKPGIEVTPSSFDIKLSIDDESAEKLVVKNTGKGALTYSAFLKHNGGSLLINELYVSHSAMFDGIEILNSGNSEMDLSGYKVVWNDNDSTSGTYTFKSGFNLAGKTTVVLTDVEGDADGKTKVYMGLNVGWSNTQGGTGSGTQLSVAILDKDGNGVDFVRSSDNNDIPPAGTSWNGDGIDVSNEVAYRNSFEDNDDNSDWSYTDVSGATVGALNKGQAYYGINWLGLANGNGTVFAGKSETIVLNIQTNELRVGEYYDTVVIKHNVVGDDDKLVPVKLVVDSTSDIVTGDLANSIVKLDRFAAAPTPAIKSETIKLRIKTDALCDIFVKIYDNVGNTVYDYSSDNLVSGGSVVVLDWNQQNLAGRDVASGSYVALLKLENNDGSIEIFKAPVAIK